MRRHRQVAGALRPRGEHRPPEELLAEMYRSMIAALDAIDAVLDAKFAEGGQ